MDETIIKESEVSTEQSLDQLSAEVRRVAKALERQNDLKRRLVTGIVFGVGTAVGASVIATLIIVGTARLLAPIGIDLVSELGRARAVLEQQIQQQTPQE